MILDYKNCVVCGAMFFPERKNQKVCSDECRVEYRKMYNRSYNLDYYHAHKDNLKSKRQEYQRRYYLENREKCLRSSREYYLKNRDKIIERQRGYRKNNPEKYREYERAYHKRKRDEVFDSYMEYLKELD